MRRNLFLATVLAAVALSASSVQAGLVSINSLGSGGSAGGSHPRTPGERGGVFNVTTSGFADVFNGSFGTFCIEMFDLVNVPAVYNGQANTSSISPVNNPLGGSGTVALASGTAWLYRQFLDGTLSTYVPSFNAVNNSTADALQEAIWAFQSQLPASGWSTYGAYGTLGLTLYNAALANANGGLYDIRIINLGSEADGWKNQDILAPVPVPAAALLGLIGVGVVGGLKRRFAH